MDSDLVRSASNRLCPQEGELPFGPREAVSSNRLAGGRRTAVDPSAGPVGRLTGWLRDNL